MTSALWEARVVIQTEAVYCYKLLRREACAGEYTATMQTDFIYDDTQGFVPLCVLKSSRYTGKERDAESGLDYFGARYYASTMGRFMSPDWAAQAQPVPYANLEYPQTLNLYSYAGNNPLSRTDPDGHFWQELGNLFKYGHYVNNAGLEGALQKDADAARKEIAGLKNLTVNGKSPGDALKGLNNKQTMDLNNSITSFLQEQVYASLLPGGGQKGISVAIAFPLGAAADADAYAAAVAEGRASGYIIQTAPSALATDVRTNITAQQFGANLEANGYTRSLAKDGVTPLYSKGNQVYSIYPNARSTGGYAANLSIDGKIVTKVRLQ